MSHPTRRGWTLVGLLVGAAVLAGCASSGPQTPPPVSALGAGDRESDEQGLYLRLISELLEDGKPHAALAYLDAIPEKRAAQPRVRLVRAEVLRRLSRYEEAEALYRELGDSDFAAQAWRGLGLIEAARGELGGARDWLERARRRQPTDARIRNDLGYALLLRGDLEAAGAELATAIELGDTSRAPRNLVLLLLVKGDLDSAEEVAARHLEADAMEDMRERAATLRARLSVGGGA